MPSNINDILDYVIPDDEDSSLAPETPVDPVVSRTTYIEDLRTDIYKLKLTMEKPKIKKLKRKPEDKVIDGYRMFAIHRHMMENPAMAIRFMESVVVPRLSKGVKIGLRFRKGCETVKIDKVYLFMRDIVDMSVSTKVPIFVESSSRYVVDTLKTVFPNNFKNNKTTI